MISAETIARFAEMSERHEAITILTHINPDVDTVGTGLGIYAWFKHHTAKRVEIVNRSDTMPPYMDFLPYFRRIKAKPDFDGSLIVACDGADAERFGLDMTGRTVINIDHHRSNTYFGTLDIVDPDAASSSQVAFALLREIAEVPEISARSFYAALLSDTRYFTTSSVTKEVLDTASEMLACGVDAAEIAEALTRRKSLASLRILERALHSLRLYCEGRVAVMYVTREEMEACGAKMYDVDGIADYGRSLRVSDIGIFAVETETGKVRVSLRSKRTDVSAIAALFGGGGHMHAAGFYSDESDASEVVRRVVETIQCKERER